MKTKLLNACKPITLVLFMGMLTANAQQLPGTYAGSWIGNTFGGAYKGYGDAWPKPTDPNDKWVQISIDCMTVEADGTCYTESGWDEAGTYFSAINEKIRYRLSNKTS